MEWDRFVEVFANPAMIARYGPNIVSGAWVTLQVSAAVIVTGIAGGLLLAWLRSYRWRLPNLAVIAFVDIFRALPPLVVILLVYFGLPNVGLSPSAFVVLWLVLSCILAAFSEEIFWAGLIAVPKGQWEAARSTGLGFTQTFAFVVLPQAVRLTIPPLTNRTIAITKNTALGTVIGVPEILNQASTAQSFSGSGTPLFMGALAYLVIFVPFVLLGRAVEKRFQWKRH